LRPKYGGGWGYRFINSQRCRILCTVTVDYHVLGNKSAGGRVRGNHTNSIDNTGLRWDRHSNLSIKMELRCSI
jgi:hypothetical protein